MKMEILGKKVRIREKSIVDAKDDYKWACDPELSQLDAAIPLKMKYEHYLSSYISEISYPNVRSKRFSVETLTGVHIGNCSYYNIDDSKGEAELGIMIGRRDYWNDGYGTDTVSTLLRYIFTHTKMKRIYLKTLISNKRAQHCFQKCGSQAYGTLDRNGYHFVLMEVNRHHWLSDQGKESHQG